MSNWIIVKVQNQYMIRKKDKVDNKWVFLNTTVVIHRTVIHPLYSTYFKWLAKRKLNKLIKSEKEENLYQKKMDDGGDLIAKESI